MSTVANSVIDFLGGTTATAKAIECPISTVHSWRSKGIPASRLAHLRLVAQAMGTPLPEDLDELQDYEAPRSGDGSDSGDAAGPSPDSRPAVIGAAAGARA